MLLSVIKYFRGYLYVRLTGYAPERFLNLCGSRDILIWNLTSCEDGYEFCISVDGSKIKTHLKKTKTRLKIQKDRASVLAVSLPKRKVFGIGLIVFAGLIYLLSGYLWNIEVNGNSHLSEEMVLDFLKEENAAFGAKIKEIDCTMLEEDLRTKYSEVIWTSIKIYGTKMTVDIQESLLPDEKYKKEDDRVLDIVASEDGVIKDMVTRSGTPLVKEAAEVKKEISLSAGRSRS